MLPLFMVRMQSAFVINPTAFACCSVAGYIASVQVYGAPVGVVNPSAVLCGVPIYATTVNGNNAVLVVGNPSAIGRVVPSYATAVNGYGAPP